MTEAQENKVQYEMTFLTTEETPDALINLFSASGVESPVVKSLEKVSLSYPIAKQKYAYLGKANFQADKTLLPAFNRVLELDSRVLRHMIVRYEDQQAKESSLRSKKDARPPLKTEVKLSEETLSNEALEKKIEEISS